MSIRYSPLRGVRVVEVSAFVAGPLAGATLAELGAEVVRIDPPGGGMDIERWPTHRGRSLYRAGLDQGKRSVVLDTRTERGRVLGSDLIRSAGILLTNLPVADWMSYARLAEGRQDLIMVVITGNSDGSPAVDYTINAAIGLPWVTGLEDAERPVNHVLPAWDIAAGHLSALATVTAQLHRVTTGLGQEIRISLADVALSIVGHLGFLAEAQLVRALRRRHGNYVFGSFGRDFQTSDGKYVMVVALTRRQWSDLLNATGLGPEMQAIAHRFNLDLDREGDRFRARREISDRLERWIANRSFDEVATSFARAHVLWGPYRTFKELIAVDPRFSQGDPMIGEVDDPLVGRYHRRRCTDRIRQGVAEPLSCTRTRTRHGRCVDFVARTLFRSVERPARTGSHSSQIAGCTTTSRSTHPRDFETTFFRSREACRGECGIAS